MNLRKSHCYEGTLCDILLRHLIIKLIIIYSNMNSISPIKKNVISSGKKWEKLWAEMFTQNHSCQCVTCVHVREILKKDDETPPDTEYYLDEEIATEKFWIPEDRNEEVELLKKIEKKRKAEDGKLQR